MNGPEPERVVNPAEDSKMSHMPPFKSKGEGKQTFGGLHLKNATIDNVNMEGTFGGSVGHESLENITDD